MSLVQSVVGVGGRTKLLMNDGRRADLMHGVQYDYCTLQRVEPHVIGGCVIRGKVEGRRLKKTRGGKSLQFHRHSEEISKDVIGAGSRAKHRHFLATSNIAKIDRVTRNSSKEKIRQKNTATSRLHHTVLTETQHSTFLILLFVEINLVPEAVLKPPPDPVQSSLTDAGGAAVAGN